jgi:hypothetical protein
MGINMHRELEALAGIDVPALDDFWKWVKAAFTDNYQQEIEEYLAQSVDHYDLERRMRALQNRGMVC